jgi:CBS-domain-containing membrane protein
MSTPVVAVSADAGFKEVVAALAGLAVGAVPVIGRDGYVLGVLSETDLLHKEEFKDADERVRPLLERRARRATRDKAAAVAAAGLMTAPAVTVTPETTLPAAARLLDVRHITRLPVVDDERRLIGIVTRSDLLRGFLRPDERIREQVAAEVVRNALWAGPEQVAVDVTDGVVTLSGQVELKSLIGFAVRLARALDGVVDVVDKLTYARDDTTFQARHDWRPPHRWT